MVDTSPPNPFYETFDNSLPVNSDFDLLPSPPPPPLTMVAASFYIPKDDPEKLSGQDAHFVFTQQGKSTFRIANGVGGWKKKGVDAGDYARELITNAIIAVQCEPTDANPKQILEQPFLNTKTPRGSSTACIVTLTPDNTLKAGNVGDSGFYVVRGGRVVYKSPVQQRSFNRPYQLGIKNDDPSVAEEIEVPLEKGDVIVAGTDGLLDNIEIVEIEENVRTEDFLDPERVALQLGNVALYNSFDRYKETPFSRAAREVGWSHRGGKVDDITVIVAYIH